MKKYPDLKFQKLATDNIEAYKYYVFDLASGVFKLGNFLNIRQALELDSTFALAAWDYAFGCHEFNEELSNRSANKYIDLAIRNMSEFPPVWRKQIRALSYSIQGDDKRKLLHLEEAHRIMPANHYILNNLIKAYKENLRYKDALDMLKKLNRLVPDNFGYQSDLANCFLLANKISKGLRYTNRIIKNNPEAPAGFHVLRGQFLLQKNKSKEAKDAFRMATIINDDFKPFKLFPGHLEYISDPDYNSRYLSAFTGSYRNEYNESQYSYYLDKGILYKKQDHRPPGAAYIISDCTLISSDGFFSTEFFKNAEGNFIKTKTTADRMYPPEMAWKEDSLIINAKLLFDQKRDSDVLEAFKKAYATNPDHFYLANFIKHLEYSVNGSFDIDQHQIDLYIGKYQEGTLFARNCYRGKSIRDTDGFYTEIYKENGLYYRRLFSGIEHEILPISENQFMVTGTYNQIIEFVNQKNGAGGFKIKLRSGREYYFGRLSPS